MEQEVQAVEPVQSIEEPVKQPDAPETGEPAVKPEVADQETQQEEQETTEDKLKRLEREAHALRRRSEKLAAKHKAAEEIARQYQSHFEQIQGANGQTEASPEAIQRAMQEKLSMAEREIEAVVAIKAIAKQDARFVENLNRLAEEAGPLMDNRGLPTALLDEIMDCEKPAKVVAYLVKNPEVAAELEGLNASRLARKLVAIESAVSGAPKVTKAPEPIKPIGTQGRGTSKSPEDMTQAEYEAWRKSGPDKPRWA